MEKKQVYESPQMMVFKVSLNRGCCQMNLSNPGIPPTSGENIPWD